MLRKSNVLATVPLALALIATAFFDSVEADQNQAIAEPATYRTKDYRSAVPLTVKGAKVIDSALQLHTFLRSNENSVLLDSYPAPHKSAELLVTELWIEPQRETLPGAVWLANTGMGNLPDELETLLKTQLRQLTQSDEQRPIIVFCEPQCWHSWNAAKRVASYGYANVYWYRQGVQGWREANYPLAKQQPVRP